MTRFLYRFCLLLAFLLLLPSIAHPQELHSKTRGFVIIDDIKVNGNKALSSGTIKSQLTVSQNRWYNIIHKKERLTDRVIEYQKSLVDSLYHVNGFLDASSEIKINSADKENHVQVEVNVVEGPRTFLKSVNFRGGVEDLNDKTADIVRNLRTGSPYNHMLVSEIAYRIRSLYTKNGYAYCRVRPVAEFSDDATEVSITINIEAGDLTTFGEINIEGLDFTEPEVVRREIQFKKGDIYNEESMYESHRFLYNSGLFNYVSMNPVYYPEKQEPPDINISLKERKPNYLNLRTGAGQDRQRDLTLNASAEYGNRNMFGTGRKIGLGVISSFQVITRQANFKNQFIFSYTEPWIFFTRMPLEIKLTYEPNTLSATQDYQYDRYSAAFTLTRELSPETEFKFTEDFESINIHDLQGDQEEIFRAEQEIRLRRKFISSFRTDKRDNILMPTRGYFTQISFEYIGGIQGGDIDLVKLHFSWNRYQVFKKSNVFAGRLQLDWLKEFGETEIVPIEDRFFLGGASTIRGYRENQLGPKFESADSIQSLIGNPKGGKLAILGNFELRRSLFWRFGGSTFIDVGNLWEDPEEFKLEDFRVTAGLGLQFFTPIGPIRADYGIRVIRAGDESGGAYHFSILYIF
ncbi:MAG: BamA/TamA family outer membrane protein [candidate division Zixibacteria bacterium]|nr:BamA/TamA family outer membrane protein [candidate division Zixibacteria bacterium]